MDLAPSNLKSTLRQPPVVIALLSVLAVLAFFGVNHLAHRFKEQGKALARHLYAQGKNDLDSGNPASAVTYFRAALSYERDNSQYQLDLARALRDTGKTDEARSYLTRLWEQSPDDGAVNLALGRLAARESSVGDAIHYYHNATYGIWNLESESHRRNAEFELIDFLLSKNARPQALAELITLAASLPSEPQIRMEAARRFALCGDDEHALSEYQAVIRTDPRNAKARIESGEAAFRLGHYASAEKYLSSALKADPANEFAEQSLKTARSILEIDPFIHSLSGAERIRRIRVAFDQGGKRLNQCSQPIGQADDSAKASANMPTDSAAGLATLRQSFVDLKRELSHRNAMAVSDMGEHVMDLVFQIETQTSTTCEPTDMDRALLLLSQDRNGADR